LILVCTPHLIPENQVMQDSGCNKEVFTEILSEMDIYSIYVGFVQKIKPFL